MRMRQHSTEDLASGLVKTITLRVSDDLYTEARKAAGAESLSAFAREALSEKVGRAALADRVAKLEQRVEQLERLSRSRS